MKIEIATYAKYVDHHPYKEDSSITLSMKDGMLLVGNIPHDIVVDGKEMLAAVKALIEWHRKERQHSKGGT